MKVLIVDDDVFSIMGMKKGIAWGKDGICSVLEASNAAAARRILENERIDIVICDIEMPDESGVELLRWVREQEQDPILIFYSCHADFVYAQNAVQLQVFEYVLKPAPYEELDRVLKRAVKQREEKLERERRQRYDAKREVALKEKFVRAVLDSTIPSTRENIQKMAVRLGFELPENSRCCLILHDIKRWEEILKGWDKIDIEFSIKNIVRELFEDSGYRTPLVFPIFEKYYATMLEGMDGTLPIDDIGSKCRHFNQVFKRLTGYGVNSYIGKPCGWEELTDCVIKLRELSKRAGELEGTVILQDTLIEENRCSYTELTDLCYQALLKQDREQLGKTSEQFFEKLDIDRVFRYNDMELFIRSYTQIVFAALEIRNVDTRYLTADAEFAEMEKKALWGPASLKNYVRFLNRRALDLMSRTGNEKNVVDAIKAYVKAHLDEEITREELSRLFYLNEDYLSRIFKKQEGIPLTQFITSEKIERAKTLLSMPGVSVTMAAEGIGISNFPYFSKMFKREIGVSPSEYKRMCQKSERE